MRQWLKNLFREVFDYHGLREQRIDVIYECLKARGGEQRGRDLRQVLSDCGLGMSGPRFYALMTDMCSDRWVRWEDRTEVVHGYKLRARWFVLKS